MKSNLQIVEHLGKFERLQLVEDLWDDFVQASITDTSPDVLAELDRRAAWRDKHPNQGKCLSQIAQSLGVKL